MIVAIFGGLYAASSKATGAVATFEPVPWALAFYFIFTIVRLGWSYTGSLPVWFVVLSTIVDMSVLFGLIWSFHITYGQPPAFYLKAPTLIYVFIFISIRALQFEVFYVLLAGGIAIAGWSALTFYAAWAHPLVENIVTSNYVEYIYQPKLLWGAEIDKIVAMTVVTGILAIGVARARRLLESEHDATARLRHLAYTDPATNLPNLARLREIITTERDDQPIGIICLDLHGFREQSARIADHLRRNPAQPHGPTDAGRDHGLQSDRPHGSVGAVRHPRRPRDPSTVSGRGRRRSARSSIGRSRSKAEAYSRTSSPASPSARTPPWPKRASGTPKSPSIAAGRRRCAGCRL